VKRVFVIPKALDYSVAYDNHLDAMYQTQMPISFVNPYASGSDEHMQHGEFPLQYSTISLDYAGVLTGSQTLANIAAFDLFERPSTNNLIRQMSAYHKEPQVIIPSDMILTARVCDNDRQVFAEYSISSNNSNMARDGSVVYHSNLGPDSSLSLHITRIQRLEDGAKLGAFYYCLSKKFKGLVFNKDVRAVVRAYVDAHAFKDLRHKFEFSTGHGQPVGLLDITPVAGFV